MNTDILTNPDSACDHFVSRRPLGKICFLPAWSHVVTRAAHLKSFYLVARDHQKIQGILPLIQVRSYLFGNHMISQAFSNYGGILADSPEAYDGLFNRAVKLAVELNCEFIEFRNITALPYDLHLVTDKMCMHLPLTANPDDLWNSFKPKVRNQVRKAEKAGLIASNGSMELFDTFYRVYAIRMHQLGSPCSSRKLLQSILEAFPDHSQLFVVRLGKLTIGAAFVTSYNDFVEIPWAATLVQYNHLCPNNLLYWTIIKHYSLRGAKWFDFGRSTVDSGTYRFKKQWGPKPIKLNYQYWVKPGHKLSIPNPHDPKYKWKVEMWKKLPLWMTCLIGPYISRNLPQ